MIELALVPLAATAQADERVSLSGGYSFLYSRDGPWGNAPIGGYLSVADRGPRTIELDLGCHLDRDSPSADGTRETLTAAVGLKLGRPGGRSSGVERVRPYVHLLGGLRHDWRPPYLDVASTEDTAWGGMGGFGIDRKAGESFSVRLGADFQIFFDKRGVDRTETLRSLRVLAGLTF